MVKEHVEYVSHKNKKFPDTKIRRFLLSLNKKIIYSRREEVVFKGNAVCKQVAPKS
jgi:hypothetical protein